MNIDGRSLEDCTDEELRAALSALTDVVGAECVAQIQAITRELERREAAMDQRA